MGHQLQRVVPTILAVLLGEHFKERHVTAGCQLFFSTSPDVSGPAHVGAFVLRITTTVGLLQLSYLVPSHQVSLKSFDDEDKVYDDGDKYGAPSVVVLIVLKAAIYLLSG